MHLNHQIRSGVETRLEQSIINGLKFEWKQAKSILPTTIQFRLRMPVFQLKEIKKWGTWSPDTRTLTLSKAFVFNYPWKDVIDVLRHEMAHLIAHEILDAHNEKPHGPSFREACDLLCADPKATGSYKPLDQMNDAQIDTEEDRIRLKIQKLLSLAQSPHQAEAEAACTKANELLLKYNLNLRNHRTPQTYISRFITDAQLRHSRDRHFLAGLLMEFFFVECVWSTQWVVAKNKQGRVLEISGNRTNIETAHYAFDYINTFIDLEWKRFLKAHKPFRKRKVDFAIGVIEGFRAKLNNERNRFGKAHQLPSKALVQVKTDASLKKYLRKKYLHLSTKSMGKKMIDRNAFDKGHQLGQELVISKGITRKDGFKGKLLS